MYYIYTLSYDNNVFYVGCTKHPLSRFINHMGGNTPATRYIIYKHTVSGILLDFDIVQHSRSKKKALIFERELILNLANAGVKLVNRVKNPDHNLLTVRKPINFNRKASFIYRFDGGAMKNICSYINKYVKRIPEHHRINYKNEIVPGHPSAPPKKSHVKIYYY